MSRTSIYLSCLGLMIAGSLLPWWCSGDLFYTCVPGFTLYWSAGIVHFANVGGGPIVCLGILLGLVALGNPLGTHMRVLLRWGVASLCLITLFQAALLLLVVVLEFDTSSATVPHIGLPIALIGVFLFVVVEVSKRHNSRRQLSQRVARGKRSPIK